MKKIAITGFYLTLITMITSASPGDNDENDNPKIFTAGRIGMTHSVDLPAAGELYFLIGHRFGEITGGFYDLYGLDLATIRLGFDYGITDDFAVGIGRSTWEKSTIYFGFRLSRVFYLNNNS